MRFFYFLRSAILSLIILFFSTHGSIPSLYKIFEKFPDDEQKFYQALKTFSEGGSSFAKAAFDAVTKDGAEADRVIYFYLDKIMVELKFTANQLPETSDASDAYGARFSFADRTLAVTLLVASAVLNKSTKLPQSAKTTRKVAEEKKTAINDARKDSVANHISTEQLRILYLELQDKVEKTEFKLMKLLKSHDETTRQFTLDFTTARRAMFRQWIIAKTAPTKPAPPSPVLGKRKLTTQEKVQIWVDGGVYEDDSDDDSVMW